jgi:hypothetical protein
MPAGVSTHSSTAWIARLRGLALAGLPSMYRAGERRFVFALRGRELRPSGHSNRYTAIVLLGLLREDPAASAEILRGDTPRQVLDRLVCELARHRNLGDAALTSWAAWAWEHPQRAVAREWLRKRVEEAAAPPTVELAWALAALVQDPIDPAAAPLAERVADQLLQAYRPAAHVFAHRAGGPAHLRGHVACFADQVYPIYALARYFEASGMARGLEVARECGEHICHVMGAAGQWWWHYDVRTGAVLEPYPVYAVHQDGMAPLALLALGEAGGPRLFQAVERGLGWLQAAPELGGRSLVDQERGVIWRKVARREPGRLSRGLQAAVSRVHPELRAPVGWALRPGGVDYETRPYHLGWLLFAWPPARAATWSTEVGP